MGIATFSQLQNLTVTVELPSSANVYRLEALSKRLPKDPLASGNSLEDFRTIFPESSSCNSNGKSSIFKFKNVAVLKTEDVSRYSLTFLAYYEKEGKQIGSKTTWSGRLRGVHQDVSVSFKLSFDDVFPYQVSIGSVTEPTIFTT